MSKLKFHHTLLYFLIFVLGCSFLIVGCGNEPKVSSAGLDEAKSLGPLEDYFNPDAVSDEISPEELAIGTAISPYFTIANGHMIYCQGQDIIVLRVYNWSGWAFQYLTWYGSNGDAWWAHMKHNYMPFYHTGYECPKQPPFSHLGPGENAFLYLPVEHTPGFNTYDIWVRMCTYEGVPPNPPSSPDNCVLKNFTLTVGDMPYASIFFTVVKQWLCWKGPDSAYSEFAGLGEGDVVQVVGVAEVPDWLVILHPKYKQECYVEKEVLKFPNFNFFNKLEVKTDPILPPECPKGTEWDPKTETCVEKEKDACSKYTTQVDCRAAGCTWDSFSATCKP